MESDSQPSSTSLSRRSDARSGDGDEFRAEAAANEQRVTVADPDQRRLCARWPMLLVNVRAAIVALAGLPEEAAR